MNSKTEIEGVTLSKSDSRPPLSVVKVRAGHRDYRRMQKRYSDDSKQSPARARFNKAFSRALFARTRHLGRKLKRFEWINLRNSVRKQCRLDKTDKLSLELREIRHEIAQLRSVFPGTAVSDSFRVMELRLDSLRQHVMNAIDEHTSVRETCPHFMKRVLCYAPDLNRTLHFEKIPGVKGIFSYKLLGQLEQLCCPSCLTAREECYFSWTGDNLSFPVATGYSCIKEKDALNLLSSISPLSIQSIWTSLCSLQMRTRVE